MRRLVAVLLAAAASGFAESSVASFQPGTDSVLEIKGKQKKALLRFDLSGLPAGATVVAARLVLVLDAVTSEPPVTTRRFAVACGDARVANLVVKAAGEYSVDLTKRVRRVREVEIAISGLEANPGATVARATLEIRHSTTAPRADAGGEVFQAPGHSGPIRVDGRRSALPGGATKGLRYAWTVEKPAWGSPHGAGEKLGSAPVLSFTPKTPGYYVLKLRVTNSATGEFTEDTTAVMTALRPHPRLQLDGNVLAQIGKLRDARDPLWERFYNRLKSRPAPGAPGMQANLWTSYLLAALVTGEKEMFDAAWTLAAAKLYKNGKDRSGGVVRLIDLYGGDQHKAAFQGGQFTGQMAVLYDWGYGFLTPEQRQDIIAWLNGAVEHNYLHSGPAQSMMRNDGAAVTYGLAAAAYATLGDNPEATQTARLVPRHLGRDRGVAGHHRQGRRLRRRQRLRRLAHGLRLHSRRQHGLLRVRRRPVSEPRLLPAAAAVRRFRRLPRHDRRAEGGGELPGAAHRRAGVHRRRRPPRRVLAQRRAAAQRPDSLAPVPGHARGGHLELGVPPARSRYAGGRRPSPNCSTTRRARGW